MKATDPSDRDKLIAEALRMTDFHDRFGKKNETAILLRALVAELVRDTPREVSTVAELDALPDGSVIQGSADMYPFSVFAKDADRGWEDRLWWSIGSDLPDSATYMLPMAPFTVLFTPTSKDEGTAESSAT